MRDVRMSKWQLPVFFALAFTISWSVQIPVLLFASARDEALTNEANTLRFLDLFQGDVAPELVLPFLLVTFTFGPSIAGVITIALFHGTDGLRDLWRRSTKVGVPLRWIVAVLLIPLALSLASVVLAFVFGGFQPVEYEFLVPLALAVPFLLYMIIFTGLAEELGWRGYALPELQKRRTAESSSWILGIFWGLWHLPTSLLGPYLRGELTVPLTIAIVLGLTLGIVGWTIVLTWIYNNTGSVFWIIILHGWANAVQSYGVLSSGNYLAQVIYGVLPWVIAVVVLRRFGGETLRVPSATVLASTDTT